MKIVSLSITLSKKMLYVLKLIDVGHIDGHDLEAFENSIILNKKIRHNIESATLIK